LTVGFHVLAALFLGFATATVLLTIHEAEAVSADSLEGAFSGYLLAGVAFVATHSARPPPADLPPGPAAPLRWSRPSERGGG
jgi:hypothetical protein